jgi:ubiquinone biosynthesis protein COQ4
MLRQLFLGGAGGARYAGHVPTTVLEKALLGSTSAVRALANPREAHLVGVVGETTGAVALRKLLHRMERNPVGRAILQDRPLITSETLPMSSLRAMPAGSLGAAYALFLDRHGFDPDERSPVRFVDDPDLAYVMLRYRQVHDLWHVIHDLPPTFMGEVALKWLEAAQTGLPMCTLGALSGGVRLKPSQRAAIARHVLPWAARHALRGPDLMSVYYEHELHRPLVDLRAELGVEPLPAEVR